ncbi:hypothetical protein A9Q87_01020 [Flavobacteriales bacterium 34_180_T64]|nr:hypothetical protein A9Q87_01020 [Flavobacteriales bacterium 34_180_T64]
MKKEVLFFALIGLLFSCNNDDSNNYSETELIGRWKLAETLADPGDGSGTFSTVISEKIIQFHADGIVTSNGTLCDLSILSETPSNGTYSMTELTISSSECVSSGLGISFELSSSILIMNYPCIEPCKAKFIKIE